MLPGLVTSVDVSGEEGECGESEKGTFGVWWWSETAIHAQGRALPLPITTTSPCTSVLIPRPRLDLSQCHPRGLIPGPQGNCSKALSVVMRYRHSLQTGAPRFLVYWTKVTVIPRTNPRLQPPELFRQQVVLRWTRGERKHSTDPPKVWMGELEAPLIGIDSFGMLQNKSRSQWMLPLVPIISQNTTLSERKQSRRRLISAVVELVSLSC